MFNAFGVTAPASVRELLASLIQDVAAKSVGEEEPQIVAQTIQERANLAEKAGALGTQKNARGTEWHQSLADCHFSPDRLVDENRGAVQLLGQNDRLGLAAVEFVRQLLHVGSASRYANLDEIKPRQLDRGFAKGQSRWVGQFVDHGAAR